MKNTKLQKYYPWIVVALLWVVALLNYMDRQMLSTMRESMQVDIAELEEAVNFGRLMAIFLWIYGLGVPLPGPSPTGSAASGSSSDRSASGRP